MKFVKEYLKLVSGINFSGRSAYLKGLVSGISTDNNYPYLHAGELPRNYISAIAPTVEQELLLHSPFVSDETKANINSLLNTFNYQKHFEKNPFNLSGGEQAILILITSLLLEPKILTIDSTLEQLHEDWRISLLNAIKYGQFPKTECYISDNRIEDYKMAEIPIVYPPATKNDYKYIFDPINPGLVIPNTQKPPIIELNKLSFSYGVSSVFKNFSIQLEPGKIYHLNGRNGAGKTTLAKILAGLLKVKDGMLTVDSIKYKAYNYPGELVGYSYQNPDEQLFYKTVEEEILPTSKKENPIDTERRELFLTIFGLQQVRKCHPGELPFTMRKRISLAATLAVERPWYILDEPTLGQDDKFINDFSYIIKSMATSGKGIIFISHAKKFADMNSEKYISLYH